MAAYYNDHCVLETKESEPHLFSKLEGQQTLSTDQLKNITQWIEKISNHGINTLFKRNSYYYEFSSCFRYRNLNQPNGDYYQRCFASLYNFQVQDQNCGDNNKEEEEKKGSKQMKNNSHCSRKRKFVK